MNPRLRLVCAAALFSTAGAAIKWCQFGAWQIAAFRGLVAGVTILLLIPAARRSWSWRAAAVGLAYAGAGIFFVLANKLTTAANTVFLQATNPLYILLLAPWILHERLSRGDLLYMAAVASGLVLLFSGAPRHFATAPDPQLGNILAEGSAVCWALTVIGYRWIARGARDARGAVASAAATGNFMVFALALPFALPLAAGRAADWATVTYLGVFQLGVAYVFLSRAIPHVPALAASLVMLVEPVLNPIWAWLVHGETPAPLALGGGLVILGATVVKTLRDARTALPAPVPVLEP
jgi:drug/metabolite transporter (DMT)-like permease